MKVIGLDDREYTWNLSKHKPKNKCSTLHERARQILKNEFVFEKIYEEVTLPGSKTNRTNRPLFADFFITPNIMIEVQGQQHYKYNTFFFNNKLEFFRAQSRDRTKQEWCDKNNIVLIQLPFCETDEEWLKRIRNKK